MDVATLLSSARVIRARDPRTALTLARQAYESSTNEAEAAVALLLSADVQHDLADFEAAVVQGSDALRRLSVLNDLPGCIDSHNLMGRCLEKLGRHESALVHHEEALRLSRSLPDDLRASRSLLGLGVLRYDSGDYLGAVTLYLEALELAQRCGDGGSQGRALGCIGNAYERMGVYSRSLEYHAQCLSHYDAQTWPRERSYALNNIGNVYVALEQYAQALSFHKESLQLKRELTDRWGQVTSLQNIAACHLNLGDLDAAKQDFEASLPLAEQIGDQEGLCVAWQGLGDVAARGGDLAAAEAAYRTALETAAAVGSRYEEVTSLLSLGKVLRQQQRITQAEQELQRALELAIQLKTRRLEQRTHEELSVLNEQRGLLVNALKHSRSAYLLEREVTAENLDTKLRHLHLQFKLEKVEHEKESHRLRHVELARLNEELVHYNERLMQANEEKAKMLRTLDRQKRQLERLSSQDALTGLYNRRHFDRQLTYQFQISRRYGRTFSLMICDIDNFKQINDRFSHQRGDDVLRLVGRLLRQSSRRTDLVARYGGEEFVLLFPYTSAKRSFARCESLRSLVERHPWQALEPDLRVTLSIGLCDGTECEAPELLLAEADRRLYFAKRNGKNQVVMQIPDQV